MADITIDSNVSVTTNEHVQPRSLVWTNSGTGYAFFLDNANAYHYRKSTDGGGTWGTEVEIETSRVFKQGIWYDGWTKGIIGSTIHICSTISGAADIVYRTLDTTDDSLGAAQTVFDGASESPSENWNESCISVVKVRGGSIYAGGWIDGNGENGFFASSNGSSWSSRTTVADGNEMDMIQFLPASGPDANDCWSIYHDKSAGSISLKVYDSSANSWNETAIGQVSNESTFFTFDSVVRNSDEHAILFAFNTINSTTGDGKLWDITGSNTVTEKTDVVTDVRTFLLSIFLDQQSDDIYVSYSKGTTVGSVLYQKSTDGGDTWDGETAMSVTSDDHRMSTGGTSIGNDGGRFQPFWFNDDLNDLVTNKDNSIEFGVAVAAAAVDIYGYSDVFVNISYAG